ncbi:DinB family protein [Paenibacillus sp. MER 99-2]|uniref:DinB family protein n=1 Tax=Paenibacillus sp. MER 99-2 TaxID=2939572 RepID=UPI00203FBFD3|nr:DinB family protein [Paenibacillus sp. MER 99-2]MCM3172916.1 DinB family protein [Paenibacillus sp. MER 99-2]
MMSYKSILIDQLTACYNDKSWFIPLAEILDDLTAEEAVIKNDNEQSIWSIVNHLIFWNEKWLERFKAGEFRLDHNIDNDETFAVAQDQLNEIGWTETLNKLENVFVNWRVVLEETEESKLTKQLPEYFDAPWWGVVSNLSIHNAYHVGQIMLLKKQMRVKK